MPHVNWRPATSPDGSASLGRCPSRCGWQRCEPVESARQSPCATCPVGQRTVVGYDDRSGASLPRLGSNRRDNRFVGGTAGVADLQRRSDFLPHRGAGRRVAIKDDLRPDAGRQHALNIDQYAPQGGLAKTFAPTMEKVVAVDQH